MTDAQPTELSLPTAVTAEVAERAGRWIAAHLLWSEVAKLQDLPEVMQEAALRSQEAAQNAVSHLVRESGGSAFKAIPSAILLGGSPVPTAPGPAWLRTREGFGIDRHGQTFVWVKS